MLQLSALVPLVYSVWWSNAPARPSPPLSTVSYLRDNVGGVLASGLLSVPAVPDNIGIPYCSCRVSCLFCVVEWRTGTTFFVASYEDSEGFPAVPDKTRSSAVVPLVSSVFRAEQRTGSTFFASNQEYHTSVIGTIGEGS